MRIILLLVGGCSLAACGAEKAPEPDMTSTHGQVSDPDMRQPIVLNPHQRQHVLEEMQGFLQGVHGITEGLATHDRAYVAEMARTVGPKQPGDGSGLRMNEALSPEFRQMGRQVRMGFNEIATLAENGGEDEEILSVLSSNLATCNACHAIYKIEEQQAE